MTVLLSIKPKYVNKIKKGSKLYEFRRTIFKQKTEEIYVYATSPIKKIVGKIIVDNIISDNPKQLWKSYHKQAGINKKDFFDYFEGKELGYAIKIKHFELFEKAIDPYQVNPKFVAPQSYAYIYNIFPGIDI